MENNNFIENIENQDKIKNNEFQNELENNNQKENLILPNDNNVFEVTEVYGPVAFYNNERFYLVKTSESDEFSFEPESNFFHMEKLLEKLKVNSIDDLDQIYNEKQRSLTTIQKSYQNRLLKNIQFDDAYLGDINIDIPLKIIRHDKKNDKEGDLAYEIEWKNRINNFKPINSICFHSTLEENYPELINEFLIKNLYC